MSQRTKEMTTNERSRRQVQRQAREKNRVEAPRVMLCRGSESSRMFRNDPKNPFNDSFSSDCSSVSTSQLREVSDKMTHNGGDSIRLMGSLVSSGTDGQNMETNHDRRFSYGGRTGQDTAQETRTTSYSSTIIAAEEMESKNLNPFSGGGPNSARVGPFLTSEQDFMAEYHDHYDQHIDHTLSEEFNTSIKSLNDWKADASARLKSLEEIDHPSLAKSWRQMDEEAMGLVDRTTVAYDQNPFNDPVKPASNRRYHKKSQADDRQQRKEKIDRSVRRSPGERMDGNKTPLFEETTNHEKNVSKFSSKYKLNHSGKSSKELMTETHRPRCNDGDNRDSTNEPMYASMQQLLEDQRTSPFEKKRMKRRKLTKLSLLALLLCICGGAGYSLYFFLWRDDGNISTETNSSEIVQIHPAPVIAPSWSSKPISPSGRPPVASVTNGAITPDDIDIADESSKLNASSHYPSPPSETNPFLGAQTANNSSEQSDVLMNSTFVPSAAPGTSDSSNLSAMNESSPPSVFSNSSFSNRTNANNSFTPTSLPSIVNTRITENETTNDSNITGDESNLTISGNETGIDANATIDNNDTTNETFTDGNQTAVNETFADPSFLPTLAPTLTPSLTNNGTTNLNVNESLFLSPSPSDNSSDMLNDAQLDNETIDEASGMPTSVPFYSKVSDSPLPSPALAGLNNSLDDLSEPWSLYLTIEHDKQTELFGTSVDTTADGSLIIVGAKDAVNMAGVATGAVYLYSLGTSNKLVLLQIIYGEYANDEFGNALAISDDGSVLVIGSRSENNQLGSIRVYSKPTSKYVQLGNTIVGPVESGRAGWAVALSGDGKIVAMGSPKGGSKGGGSVLTYQYDKVTWVQYGSEIEGIEADAVGYSVSLNIDGTVMSVGNPKAANRGGASNAGQVSVYLISGSEWTLVGEIFGLSSEDVLGTSVALSENGQYLVTGSKGTGGDNGIIESAGSCQIYRNPGNNQWRLKTTISGESPDERLGSSAAISRDGSLFACGGVTGSLNGSGTTGVVRLWNKRTSRQSSIWPRSNRSEESAFGTSLSFSSVGLVVGAPDYSGGSGGILAGSIEIYSMD